MATNYDPNRDSKLASLIWPENKPKAPAENWLTIAAREDRERKTALGPVVTADASGQMPDFTSGTVDVSGDRGTGDAVSGAVSVISPSGSGAVWGGDSLGGVAESSAKKAKNPAVIKVDKGPGAQASLAPENDPLYGSGTYTQPLPKPPAPQSGTAVDMKFMKFVEGRNLDAEVPTENGIPYAASGATVAKGFDLGQWSEADLNKLGLTDRHELFRKVKPYLGRKGQDALDYLKANPLRITDEEADWADNTLLPYQVKALNSHFAGLAENTEGKLFTDLPPDIQTVVYSVAHHKGMGGFAKLKEFNSAVLSGDPHIVVDQLMKIGMNTKKKAIAERRFKEASYLYNKYAGDVTP